MLFANNRDEALAVAKIDWVHRPYELVEIRETEKYFEFKRMEKQNKQFYVLSRVHKSSYYEGCCPYNCLEDYDAPSEFAESDFKGSQTPQALIEAIKARSGITVTDANSPIESLNKLLEEKDLYKAMSTRSDNVRELLGRLEKGQPLSPEELKKLNRGLLEDNYARETPRRRNPFEIVGYLKFRPMTKDAVKEFIEYLWYIKNWNYAGTKVLSSSIKENQDGYTHTIEVLNLGKGDWGLYDSIALSEETYYINKSSGQVKRYSKTVRSIQGHYNTPPK